MIRVEGLSSTARNARLIRDAVMSMPAETGPPRIVLIGYSKGSNDILEALVTYPELRPRVAAVVSAAGSIGGSPLANDAEQDHADLLRHFPGATCGVGRWGRRRELASRRAQGMAGRESAAKRVALLLGGHLSAAGANLHRF